MSKTSIDLEADLSDLAKESRTLRGQVRLYQLDVNAENVERESLSKAGLASNTTKLYSGCERIMEYFTKEIDKAPIGRDDGGWHAKLLKRMAEPYPDIRAAIISAALFDQFDRLRSFRHFERNSYGWSLDGQIVAERAGEMADAADLFCSEVHLLLRTDLAVERGRAKRNNLSS